MQKIKEYFIYVKNMFVHIAHTRERDCYENSNLLVQILHAVWDIGTNSSWC